MRENMPGGGRYQGDGYVDKGPRIMNSFDALSERSHLLQDIRNVGHDVDGFKPPRKDGDWAANPYGQPGSARYQYATALRAFFDVAFLNIEPGPGADLTAIKWHLESIMRGQSLREAATELGVSFQAVEQARKRAVKRLMLAIGKDLPEVADELVFFLMSEGGVSLAGRLPDRVLAVSTKWKGF